MFLLLRLMSQYFNNDLSDNTTFSDNFCRLSQSNLYVFVVLACKLIIASHVF